MHLVLHNILALSLDSWHYAEQHAHACTEREACSAAWTSVNSKLSSWLPAASKAGEKTAEEAQSPSLPLPSPVPTPEEVKPKPDDNPFAGLLNSCAPRCLLNLPVMCSPRRGPRACRPPTCASQDFEGWNPRAEAPCLPLIGKLGCCVPESVS